MARGADQTMAEGLQKILAELATLQIAPDADPAFLAQLSQAIVGKIKAGMSPTEGPGQKVGIGNPMGPGAGAAPPGAGPGPSALMPGQGVSNMDEIRRMLSQGAAGGQGGGVLPGAAA